MEQDHVAPIGTLALALTLALGTLLVAPDAGAASPTEQNASPAAGR
jgi:hypothetical protein